MTPANMLSQLGTLTTAQQVRAVELGWLQPADVSAGAAAQAANLATVKADLRALLASLDALIGQAGDAPGTSSLRAIKNQTNATINSAPAPYVKALADGMIAIARGLKKDVRLGLRSLDGAD